MGTKEQQKKGVEVDALSTSTTHSNVRITTTTTTLVGEISAKITPTQNFKIEEDSSLSNEKRNQVNIEEKQMNYQNQLPRATTLPAPQPTPTVLIIPATQASTLATNAAKKIRRAFSMPRNPFRWSRKFKTSIAATSSEYNNVGTTNGGNGGSVHGIGSAAAITLCVGGGRGRSGSIISLNSYETPLASKDTNGNMPPPAVIVNGCGGGGGDVSDTTAHEINCNNKNSNKQILKSEKKLQQDGTPSVTGNNNSNCNNGRVLRRSSFRKFLNRIAQHLNASVNVGANKRSTFSTVSSSAAAAERVPPINVAGNGVSSIGYQWPADQTPGVMGLKNHGNTCFMNAVLQCLSHTDILAEYFVLDQYKVDLKRRNKINSRKFGTKGELTEQLANVLKALWTCKNESDHSTSFKAVVDRYGSQFRSSTQHDAQEFLFWLLDKVHEDLNTATKRRYKSVKNNYGRPDEIIAAETLANHIRCNNSFVQAVFQAQFRSSLTCPRCKKQSNTFDPFHCISVQLPQLQQQIVFVTVIYMKQQPAQVRMGLTVPAGSPIVALREKLQSDTGIASDRMVLADLNKEGFARVFYDTQPVETLKGTNNIYCIEMPNAASSRVEAAQSEKDKTIVTCDDTSTTSNVTTTSSKNNETDLKSVPTSHATDLLLLVANVHTKQQPKVVEDGVEGPIESELVYERFGPPFSMKVPRDCSYLELQKKILNELSSDLQPEAFTYEAPLVDMFKIRLQDPSVDPVTYLEQVEHPLLTEMIDMALTVLSAEAGPPHIKLVLEWTTPELHFLDMAKLVTKKNIVEHESVALLNQSKPNDTATLTLEQCLEHYTKAETLSAEDAWRCPHCQQYLPVVKTLGLWSLPDILVVHFKRFRQHQSKGPQAAKLTTMVKFPLNSFDMAPHLARGINGENNATTLTLDPAALTQNYRPSPWKKTRNGDSKSSTLNSRPEQKDTRYDLYAVCYHQGDTLETGHYTAACKNPYDRQWYKFDDQRVTKVPDDAIQQEIINNEAYMLFYQRRIVDSIECSGSSSNSGDHWVSRIVPPPQVSKEKDPEKIDLETQVGVSVSKEDDSPEIKAVDLPSISSEAEILTPPIKEQHEMLNIEELDYADADVICQGAELAVMESLTITEPITKTTSENITSDANDIFDMDEDCLIEKAIQKVITDENDTNLNTNTTETSPTRTNLVSLDNSIVLENNIKANNVKVETTTTNDTSTSTSVSSLSSVSITDNNEAPKTAITALQNKFNGYTNVATASYTNGMNDETQLSSSLKSYSGSINCTVQEFNLTRQHFQQHNQQLHHRHHNQSNWHGSRSSVSAVETVTAQNNSNHAHSLNLRHSFSTSSNYKLRECSETLSSLLRNTANTCSKDTLLFIDQQSHHHNSLIEDEDDTFMGRSLWISPVTPHKLITVSPKN